MATIPIKEPVITLSAGPVACYPRVLRAMSRPVHYDFDPFFQHVYERTVRKVTKALKSKEPALVLQCEPAPGLEACAASLIGPNDVVLNLVSGVYGKGFGYWAARYAKEVIEVEVPYDQAIDPADVAKAFKRRKDIKVVTVVHHDTPSGTLNPVKDIGRIVREHDALLLVDAVSSFAGMDIHPDDCFADVFVTGPGKCLGGPPGLTIIGMSKRAWKHIARNPKAPTASILSLGDWKDAWRHDRPFPFTPSVADINGLEGCMDQYLEEGPKTVWRRHERTAQACRAAVKAMGLKLWPASEAIAAPTCTAVRVPAGIDDGKLLAAAREEFGVVFSSGRGETKGKLIRIGHMGPVAEPIYATIAAIALGGALRRLGHNKANAAKGVEAAMAVIAKG